MRLMTLRAKSVRSPVFHELPAFVTREASAQRGRLPTAPPDAALVGTRARERLGAGARLCARARRVVCARSRK